MLFFVKVRTTLSQRAVMTCAIFNRQRDCRNSRFVRLPTSGISQFEKQQDCLYPGPWLCSSQIP